MSASRSGGEGSNQYQTLAGGRAHHGDRADTAAMVRALDALPDDQPPAEKPRHLSTPQRMNLENFSQSIMEFARDDVDVRASYDLDPPYQRGSVWSDDQKRNLCYSLLVGIPIGAVITNERTPSHEAYDALVWQAIVDGKQRITAARDFVDSKVAVPAVWFADDEYGTYIEKTSRPIEYEGHTVEGVLYRDLTQQGKGKFGRTTIAVCKGQLDSIAEEARLYNLVNFGGVAQTDEDRDRADRVAAGGE